MIEILDRKEREIKDRVSILNDYKYRNQVHNWIEAQAQLRLIRELREIIVVF